MNWRSLGSPPSGCSLVAEVGLGSLAAEERWHNGNVSWTDIKKSSVLGCLSKVANAAAPTIETGGGDRGFEPGLGLELGDLELGGDLRFEDNLELEDDLEDLRREGDLGFGLEGGLEDLGLELGLGDD